MGLFIVKMICTQWTCVSLSDEKIFTPGHSRFTWHSLHVGKKGSGGVQYSSKGTAFRLLSIVEADTDCVAGKETQISIRRCLAMSVAWTHLHYFCFCHFIIKHSFKKMDRRPTWRQIVVTWRHCVECRSKEVQTRADICCCEVCFRRVSGWASLRCAVQSVSS